MGKNQRNEKRKLTATLMNGLGLAVFGVTFATAWAKYAGHNGLLGLLAAAVLIVGALHLLARIALRGMEE